MRGPDHELLQWRMYGVMVWQFGVSVAVLYTWHVSWYAATLAAQIQPLGSPLQLLRNLCALRAVVTSVGIAALQSVAVATFTKTVAVGDPSKPSRLPPALNNIVALPHRQLIAAMAGYSITGAVSTSLWGWAAGVSSGHVWLAGVGCLAGLATLLRALAMQRHVVATAPVKESRVKQIRRRFPEGMSVALRLTATTAASVVAAAIVLPKARTWSLELWLTAGTATFLQSFLWVIGLTIVQAIFGEPLAFQRFYGGGAYSAMLAALPNNDAPLLQQLAFQKLASVAWADPALRKPLWADSSAATWHAATMPCVLQLESAAAAVAAATTVSPMSGILQGDASPAQWNKPTALSRLQAEQPWQISVPAAVSAAAARVLAAVGGAPPADPLEWQLRSGQQRTEWCLHALAGFSVASRQEDHFGVAQLSHPGLPRILQALLAAQLAFSKAAVVPSCSQAEVQSSGSAQRGQNVAETLLASSRAAVEGIIRAFGQATCCEFLKAATDQPAMGTRRDLLSLLNSEVERLQTSVRSG